MRRLLLIVSAGLLVAMGCGGGGGGSAGGRDVLDATFARFDGSTQGVAAYRGKPVVVNFFSSTCGPCVREMPSFEQVHLKLGARVTFLGIDVQETAAAGQPFIEAMKITWELGRDPDGSVLREVGGIGLPTTLILDADGKVVYKHLGAVPDGELESQLRDQVGVS